MRGSQAPPAWKIEGLSGIFQQELTPQIVRRAAAAFAAHLFQTHKAGRPKVVVAGDGRPLTADLMAATAEAVCWSGCDLIEIGSGTSGSLAMAVRTYAAEGGLLVGNVLSEARTASLCFYGSCGEPWSLGGSLGAIEAAYESMHARPVRYAAESQRQSIDEKYLDSFGECRHSQRPLRFVFDTACGPLHDWVSKLVAPACQLIRPQPLPPRLPTVVKPLVAQPTFRARREKMIVRQVIADGADFGIWIDGIGESCTVIDDRGLPIKPSALTALLARSAFDETDARSEYVEGLTREAVFRRLTDGDAAIAGDDQGRFWFRANGHLHFDALFTLMRLLQLLNETDLPLRKLVH